MVTEVRDWERSFGQRSLAEPSKVVHPILSKADFFFFKVTLLFFSVWEKAVMGVERDEHKFQKAYASPCS